VGAAAERSWTPDNMNAIAQLLDSIDDGRQRHCGGSAIATVYDLTKSESAALGLTALRSLGTQFNFAVGDYKLVIVGGGSPRVLFFNRSNGTCHVSGYTACNNDLLVKFRATDTSPFALDALARDWAAGKIADNVRTETDARYRAGIVDVLSFTGKAADAHPLAKFLDFTELYSCGPRVVTLRTFRREQYFYIYCYKQESPKLRFVGSARGARAAVMPIAMDYLKTGNTDALYTQEAGFTGTA